MVFSSLIFMFLYLPAVLLIYYITPHKFRNAMLLVVNLVFYGWGEPVFILLMIFSTVLNYVYGYFIEKFRENKRTAKILLVTAIIINLGVLAFFKYAGMLTDTLNVLPFLNIPDFTIPLPIGISFYTFQTMSYTIDVYRGDTPAQKNIVSFGTYVSLFPQLIAGPIVRYRDVADQLDSRHENIEQFTLGVKRFMIGLGKKVLLANSMGLLWDTLRPDMSANGALGNWVGIIAYSFQIYFDFSGYSDMACGLGNMFGFEFLKNFNYPYISKSITEFWRRWHISLSTWFRDYVYIPLGGNRKGVVRNIINILIVWGLTGLWHGASYNFILWGLYFGVILLLEKFVLKNFLEKLPNAVKHLYSIVLIIFGWVLFYFDDMGQLGAFLASMFDFSNGVLSHDAMVTVLQFLPLLIAAAVASTPLASKLYDKIKNYNWCWIPETAVTALGLLVCTAALVSNSYNPFLYFRF